MGGKGRQTAGIAQMKKLLANLSLTQRITILAVALAAAVGIYALVHYQKESDFKPLFTGVAPEDGAAIVQKLSESGIEYRLPEGGGIGAGSLGASGGTAPQHGRGGAAEDRAHRLRAIR